MDGMAVSGHHDIYGGDEGLRHHLCVSHGEHLDEGASREHMEDLHEDEHGYNPGHRGEWGCPEHDPSEEPTEFHDMHEEHGGIGEIHRGIGVSLPDELHRYVHDQSRPAHERAEALLSHVSDHPEGGGHLGTHWTTTQDVAEDFAEKAAGWKRDEDERQRPDDDHSFGTREEEWDGETERTRLPKPGTAVVFHAHEPHPDVVDRDPHRPGNGDVYGYSEHGEREVPVRSSHDLDLRGISWAQVHHEDDPKAPFLTEYTHHDFGHEHTATRGAELLGHFEAAGMIDLYHHTSPETAAKIYRERRMTSKESTGSIFFTTDPASEYAAGFGDGVVHVRMPQSHLDAAQERDHAWQDDEFPSGEQHWAIHHSELKPEHFVDPGMGSREAVEAAYRGFHQAPGAPDDDATAPMHNVRNMMPDAYEHPEWYGNHDAESRRQIVRAEGNPDLPVSIYRALPEAHHEISDGDWVSTSAAYARQHGESNLSRHTPWHVVRATVPARQLFSEGNVLPEWGYRGAQVQGERHAGPFERIEVTGALSDEEIQQGLGLPGTPEERGHEHAQELVHKLLGPLHEEHGGEENYRLHQQNEDAMDLRRMYPAGGRGTHGFDEDGDPHYDMPHPGGGWYGRHYGGPEVHIRHQATGDDVHDTLDVTGRDNQVPEAWGEQHLQHAVDAWHRGEWGDGGEGTREYLEENEPKIRRWNMRHRGSAHEVVAHFEDHAAKQEDGEERPFGYYTLHHRTEDLGERKPRHFIDARTPEGAVVGRMNWFGTTGWVHHIDVAGEEDDAVNGSSSIGDGRDHQGRGLATAMWDWSQEMRPKAKHSKDQTNQGKAWVRGLKDRERRDPPEGPPPFQVTAAAVFAHFEGDAAGSSEVTVEHHERPSGGATYPHMHVLTATHPDGTTAELRYMLSKRNGKGVVDHAFLPGGYAESLGKPLVQEARRLHPGTFVKGLPGIDEDWGKHLPSVTSLHRNLTLNLEPADRDYVHDESVPRAERARFLMDHMAQGGPSMHWASQRGRAAAEQSFGDHEFRSPEHTQVAINAAPPSPEHVETDPERISRNGGYAYQVPDWEVPLREGAPVTVNSVRWRTGNTGWTHHQFKGGHQFTAGYGSRERTAPAAVVAHFAVTAADTGFSTWYHGTSAENARKIQSEGLTSNTYGGEVDEHGPLAHNPTLVANPARAVTYATRRPAGLEGPASVVEIHVPHHLAGEYLVNEGGVAGINKPLPPSMIHRVSPADDFRHEASSTVTAAEYGPKPEFRGAPDHLSDDEKMKHWDQQRQISKDWESHALHGISTGELHPDRAKELGYYFDGHQTDDQGRHKWKPLPQHLYHVTTNLPGVREHALKSRRELAQERGGHGLGGGPDDTISLTDDHDVAKNILRAVHEFHGVVNGRYTPAQMWEDAKAGKGAPRPFHEDLAGYHQPGWKDGDPLPRRVDSAVRGKELKTGGLVHSPQEMAEHEGPGWTPHHESSELVGGDGVKRYNVWERDLNPDESRAHAADFYKNFAAYRSWAGGHEDPLFFSTDTKAFAAKDPSHFAIVHARPRPGAMGHQVSALGEWRTGTGDALETHRAERLEGGHLKEASVSLASRFHPGLPNPQTGGDEWFHGTKSRPGDLVHGFSHDDSPSHEEEEMRGHLSHWNTLLGSHFAADHGVAEHFARQGASTDDSDEDDWGGDDPGASRYEKEDPQSVIHARLHLRNPKVYGSEFDMDHEAYEHEHGERKNYISKHFEEGYEHEDPHGEDYDPDTPGDFEEWPLAARYRHDDQQPIPREQMQRRTLFSNPDTPEMPERTRWLNSHPDKAGIARRFKEHLQGQGHDGILYGNEFEDSHATGHGNHHDLSAIIFHPHQAEITQHHQAGGSCLSHEEGEHQRARMPQPGQEELPGAEEHADHFPNGFLRGAALVAHFEEPKTAAGPFMQQKLFHVQPDPTKNTLESGRHNPDDPLKRVRHRQETEEGYVPPAETFDHPEYGNRDEEWGTYHHPVKGWHCHACGEFHDSPEEVDEHQTAHTDWDQEYPRIPDTVHRGMRLDDDGSYGRQHLHAYRSAPADESAARGILGHFGDLGSHWTGDEDQARHYADVGTGNHHAEGDTMNVVVHARKPAREDIETDPETLAGQNVYGMGYHDDEEVPLREGAPVHVTGVSWKFHDEPHAAWRRHDFGEGAAHTAALEEITLTAAGDGRRQHADVGQSMLNYDKDLSPDDRAFIQSAIDHIRRGAPPSEPINADDAEHMARGMRTRDRMEQAGWSLAPGQDKIRYPRGFTVNVGDQHRATLSPNSPSGWHVRTHPADYGSAAGHVHHDLDVRDEDLPSELHKYYASSQIRGELAAQRGEVIAEGRHEGALSVTAHFEEGPLPEYHGEPLYHGTRSILEPGEHLTVEEAERHPNNSDIQTDPYVHATTDPREAHRWGERASAHQAQHRMTEMGRERRIGPGEDADHAYRPRVYEVHPTGHVEPDLEYADTEHDSWRSAHPMRVKREVEPLECYDCPDSGGNVAHWPDHPHYEYLRQQADEDEADRLERGRTAALEQGEPTPPSFTWKYQTYGPNGGYVDQERKVAGPFYHGSRSKGLRPGSQVKTGMPTNSWGDEGDRSQFVHFTTDHEVASQYAREAGGHVYEVEPTGEVHSGYDGGEWKSQHPLRVIRRVPDGEIPPATAAVVAHFEDDEDPDDYSANDEWDEDAPPERDDDEPAEEPVAHRNYRLPYMTRPPEGELIDHLHHHHGLDARTSDLYMNAKDRERWHASEHQYKTNSTHQHDHPQGAPGEEHWPAVFELSDHTDFSGGTRGDWNRVPGRTAPFKPLRSTESVSLPEVTAVHPGDQHTVLPQDGEEMWRHLQEGHGLHGDRTPGTSFMNDLHRQLHSGQTADPRRVPHQHGNPGDRPASGQSARDSISRMFTPIPPEELEAQRRAREPKPERLDDREYSINDVSRHYDWEGFGSHEIEHLVHHPERAVFTREDVPVKSLRHIDEHGSLVPPPSYRDIAGQGDDERERLEELERGYDQDAPIPPIVAVRDGEHHIIADGSHRAAIHAERGSTHIPAFVTQRTISPGQHTAAVTAAYDWNTDEGPLTWDEIAQRHPRVYGDDEDHEPGMGEGGGYNIADAAAELYHDRPSHPYSQSEGELHPSNGSPKADIEFHPRTVDVNRIDYMRVDRDERDPRVERARKGFQDHRQREKIPPLILVHRHGVYQVADGSHRGNGAAQAHWPSVRAYVAYSPHEDEPFAGRDGEPPQRGPFHGAETRDRPPMPDANGGPARRISFPGFPHTTERPRPQAHEASRREEVTLIPVYDTAPAIECSPLAQVVAAAGLLGAWAPQTREDALEGISAISTEVLAALRQGLLRLAGVIEEMPVHPDVAELLHDMARAVRTASEDSAVMLRGLPPEAPWQESGPPNR